MYMVTQFVHSRTRIRSQMEFQNPELLVVAVTVRVNGISSLVDSKVKVRRVLSTTSHQTQTHLRPCNVDASFPACNAKPYISPNPLGNSSVTGIWSREDAHGSFSPSDLITTMLAEMTTFDSNIKDFFKS